MRKTYKLPSGQGKQTMVYKKKTLGPKTRLNVTKDEDELENIDDYWKTAESVLKDDNTIEIGETSIHRGDVSISESSLGNEANVTMQSDTLFDIKSIRENLSARSKIQDSLGIKNNLDETGVSLNGNESEHYALNRLEDEIDHEAEFESDNSARVQREPQIDDMENELNEELIENGLRWGRNARKLINIRKKICLGNEKPPGFIKGVNIGSRSMYEYRGKISCNAEGKKIAVTDISGLYNGKSGFKSLLESKTLETAIIFLNSSAFIKPEKAVFSFSVFVIKGAVCIEMNQDRITLKKGSLCIIERDTMYSVSNSSGKRCTMLLTYSII